MPSLFITHISGENTLAKRVELSAGLQETIEGIFEEQYQRFVVDVEEENPFTREWKAGKEELLTLGVQEVPAVNVFVETVRGNAIAVPTLGTTNPANIGVKALFMGMGDRILVQQFTVGQVLSRRFLLGLRAGIYQRVEEPTFSLGSSLAFVVENGLIKFRSIEILRKIMDMADVYRTATEQEVRQFATHGSLVVADVDGFVELADSPSRKMISAVIDSGVLDTYNTAYIQRAAQTTGLVVQIQNGLIVMPNNRRDVKGLLQFLTENRYLEVRMKSLG